MSYTTQDFSESVERSSVTRADIVKVIMSWGHGEGQGPDAGHPRWDEDGSTEWCGGFLFQAKDGRFCYLTGWCDYTGWGCQDGIDEHWFEVQPSPEQLADISKDAPASSEWDHEPSDLNLWLINGDKLWKEQDR